jgi:hypothetical protein
VELLDADRFKREIAFLIDPWYLLSKRGRRWSTSGGGGRRGGGGGGWGHSVDDIGECIRDRAREQRDRGVRVGDKRGRVGGAINLNPKP